MKYDVFISYSRKDSEIVKKFAAELSKAGYKYWMDRDGIESGDEFKRKIAAAIRESRVFIYFSSASSNESEWTVKEVNYAIKKKIHIIPIKLDNTDYNESVDFDLCAVDFILCKDSKEIQKAVEKLLRSLRNKIGDGLLEYELESDKKVSDPGKNAKTSKIWLGCILALLLCVVFVVAGAWWSFTEGVYNRERILGDSLELIWEQRGNLRESFVKDSIRIEYERKEKARIAEQHRLEKERLAKENAEKVRIAEQQSLERERLKQSSSQREQYVKDSIMAEYERKEKARIAEQQRLEKERLAKENAEKVRIAEQQSLERERLKQASSQREQYVKDSIMAEYERKEKARIAEQHRLEKERSAKEATERERLEKIFSTPRSSKGLLCVAAVDKNSREIAYFTADEWESLPQDVKTGYVQAGVSIREDGHEFIIAPTDCKDPDDGDYGLQFGCYDMDFDGVRQSVEISAFITTGYNATKKIVEQAKGKIDSKGIKGAPAAEAAWSYKANEYDNLQWYLPSVSELLAVRNNIDAINDFIKRCFPQGDVIINSYYWSSKPERYRDTIAWIVGIPNGGSCTSELNSSYRVRAVALAK